GAAVEAGAGDDVVTSLGNAQDGQCLRRLAGRDEQAAHATFERSDPIFDRGLGGVGDAGVDRAELSQGEAVPGLSRVVEDERGCLVEGQCARAGFLVGCLAGMDLARLEGPSIVHARTLADIPPFNQTWTI